MVRLGLVTACRRAISPTSVSPLSLKATTLGVRRLPSLFAITLGSLPSITATTELVVPRSMPMIFSPCLVAMMSLPLAVCVSLGSVIFDASPSPLGRMQRACQRPSLGPL